MSKFKVLSASILHSSDELTSAPGVPPYRTRPLELQTQLDILMATKADVLGACYELENIVEIDAVNIEAAVIAARGEFEKHVNGTLLPGDTAQIYVNGGSTPFYWKLPDGSHVTEDWLYVEGPSTPRQPWAYMHPMPPLRFRLYPVLRLHFSAPF